MATHLRTELVLEALNMALWQRRPESVIHHSDQGCQYTSFAFGKRCRLMGVRPSMESVGDCYDNAMVESFFATLECELIDRHSFKTQAEARMAIFEFIEGWYNPHRRHSSLGQADFSGGEITGDAGVLLLRQADGVLKLSEAVSRALRDSRRRASCEHASLSLVRQRLYALALGYEDLNDHQGYAVTWRCRRRWVVPGRWPVPRR